MFPPCPLNNFAKLNPNDLTEEIKKTKVTTSKQNELVKKDDKPIIIKDDIIGVGKSKFKQKIGIGSLVVLGLFGAKSMFFKEKECMEWKENDYDLVDCQSEEVGFASETLPNIKSSNKSTTTDIHHPFQLVLCECMVVLFVLDGLLPVAIDDLRLS